MREIKINNDKSTCNYPGCSEISSAISVSDKYDTFVDYNIHLIPQEIKSNLFICEPNMVIAKSCKNHVLIFGIRPQDWKWMTIDE